MSRQSPDTVSVKILDKEFRISCPENERASLMDSATMLNDRMRKIRDSGNVIGAERIAIMAALNLTHELLKAQSDQGSLTNDLEQRVRDMSSRIESTLKSCKRTETEI